MAPRRRRDGGGGRGLALILCSGTLGRIPFVDKARAAAGAGFDGISVYAREHTSGLRTVLDDLGLAVAEVDGAMAWLPGNDGPSPAQVVDVARDLGARSITVVEVSGEVPDPAHAADAFAAVCRAAAPLVVHIEPFPWSGIASLGAAAAVVEAAGESNGALLLDTWHLWRGPDAGLVTHADRIVALQVSDVAATPWSSVRDESMHGRLLPGPYARSIIEQLPGVPVEIEVFSDELLALAPADAARRAYGALA